MTQYHYFRAFPMNYENSLTKILQSLKSGIYRPLHKFKIDGATVYTNFSKEAVPIFKCKKYMFNMVTILLLLFVFLVYKYMAVYN